MEGEGKKEVEASMRRMRDRGAPMLVTNPGMLGRQDA